MKNHKTAYRKPKGHTGVNGAEYVGAPDNSFWASVRPMLLLIGGVAVLVATALLFLT